MSRDRQRFVLYRMLPAGRSPYLLILLNGTVNGAHRPPRAPSPRPEGDKLDLTIEGDEDSFVTVRVVGRGRGEGGRKVSPLARQLPGLTTSGRGLSGERSSARQKCHHWWHKCIQRP